MREMRNETFRFMQHRKRIKVKHKNDKSEKSRLFMFKNCNLEILKTVFFLLDFIFMNFVFVHVAFVLN